MQASFWIRGLFQVAKKDLGNKCLKSASKYDGMFALIDRRVVARVLTSGVMVRGIQQGFVI
ncbi:MAG: hypothetical protein OZ927_11465 [Alcaligenaceae bacterium]|nr:hypothetical protein [Alcaligenaceae bacterium]